MSGPPLSSQLFAPSPRTKAGPAGGGNGSGVSNNANNVFQASLRKGSGNGGNPTPYARRSMTPRGTSSMPAEPEPTIPVPPPMPAEHEMDPGQFMNPLAVLRDPNHPDLEYVFPGRTHPGVYNPHTRDFDGGFANYYESPHFLYDRGITLEDLPKKMPSRFDLARKPRDAEGMPLRTHPTRAMAERACREHLRTPNFTPADDFTGRIHDDRSFDRRQVNFQPSTAASGHRAADRPTVHRASWNDHFDDDHMHWKGDVPGRDVYHARYYVPGASDDRYTQSTMHRSMCTDAHGGAGRSLFNGKPLPYNQNR